MILAEYDSLLLSDYKVPRFSDGRKGLRSHSDYHLGSNRPNTTGVLLSISSCYPLLLVVVSIYTSCPHSQVRHQPTTGPLLSLLGFRLRLEIGSAEANL